ncbi:MAG TPA: type II secretion system protein M [Burkholderiales bacterium]|nr:type II secretion system protein M [Burkholderiales bacterium]
MKEQVKDYWRSRPAKDRRIILLVVAIVFTCFFYAFIWAPIEDQRRRLRAELPKLRGEAAQMKAQAGEVGALKSRPANATKASPEEIISKSAEKAGIKGDVIQITPLSAERFQVALNSVPFNNWILWTTALLTNSKLRIESAQVTETGVAGIVKVQAVLEVAKRDR